MTTLYFWLIDMSLNKEAIWFPNGHFQGPFQFLKSLQEPYEQFLYVLPIWLDFKAMLYEKPFTELRKSWVGKCSSLLLLNVLHSVISVTYGQPCSKNIKWKIPQKNSMLKLHTILSTAKKSCVIQLHPVRVGVIPLSIVSILYALPIHQSFCHLTLSE